jgi:hypothetical protein
MGRFHEICRRGVCADEDAMVWQWLDRMRRPVHTLNAATMRASRLHRELTEQF